MSTNPQSTVCTRFVHNAWKKDFCSNCFKSKEEHKALKPSSKPIKQHQPDATPSKSSIKNGTKKKKYKVSFPKELSEVIGFGGEWDSDCSAASDDDPVMLPPSRSCEFSASSCSVTDSADLDQDFSKLTKSNTDFNTNINNLITPPVESNIKRSFAALKLGSSSPKEAKKETLKITVLPFGSNSNKASSKVTEIKQIFGSSSSLNGTVPSSPLSGSANKKHQLTVSASPLANKKTESVSSTTVVVNSVCATSDSNKSVSAKFNEKQPTNQVINNCPEIVSVTEKSLLEEISETLEMNKTIELNTSSSLKSSAEVVDAVPKKDAIRLEIKNPLNKVLPSATAALTDNNSSVGNKRLINRNVPITKDHVKPKISVFSKKFEAATKDDDSDVSDLDTSDFYENVKGTDQKLATKSSSFFSSQLISDMFLANKPISKHLKSVHSEVYDLSERTYGKITSDGLIMTKNIGDAADSHTSSNFDSSSSSSCSDEEITQRSESDSGIVANEYQNVIVVEQQKTVPEEKCDEDGLFYDDVQSDVSKTDTEIKPDVFSIDKSRELAGEPDGSSDPDSNCEAPALPTTSPPGTPTAFSKDNVQSPFGSSSPVSPVQMDKPKVPLKPNNFMSKTSTPVQSSLEECDETDHQLIPVEEQTPEKLTISRESSIGSDIKCGISSPQKKGRAPNPPPSPDLSYASSTGDGKMADNELNTIYMRNPMANLKSSSPVIREKDKRGRATINPKFRSLNSINSFQKNMILNRATTPEPMPRKSLSMSHENLLDVDGKGKSMKKNKLFSIKKFLRMGSSSSTTNLATCSSKLSDIAVESRSESGSPKARPRLVIIHPIDINPSAVEVVKTTTPTSATSPDIACKFLDEKIVSGKPPAPPVRVNSVDAGKPSRPPPPKSVETRRKQQEHLSIASQETGSVRMAKSGGAGSADSVYANLGEVRSAMAPRKPERTASMREREERQLELMKRRATFKRGEDERLSADASSATCFEQHLPGQVMPVAMPADVKKETMGQGKLPASKVEIFERNINGNNGSAQLASSTSNISLAHHQQQQQQQQQRPKDTPFKSVNGLISSDGIKNSVQKMTSTIDNYLKDKSEDQQVVAIPATNLISNKFNSTNSILKDYGSPSSVAKKMHFNESVELRHYEPIVVQKPDRMSLQDPLEGPCPVYGGGSTCSNSTFRQITTPKGVSKSFVNIPRAMSYCGSEIGESEIYSPYSFCGSEAGNDIAYEDPQFGWNTGSLGKSRAQKTTNRLRMRKGRSVVHKNLEDNYGAVIVANHEALAQVLDQLQQSPAIPIQLRSVANSINLRFEDFSIMEGGRAVVIGRRAFHAAIWANQTPVTLSLTADCNQGVAGDLKQSSGAASGALNPIAEFFDLVPSNYLPLMPSVQVRMVQASISVLPRLYVDTLMSLGNILKSRAQQLQNHQHQQQSPLPNQKHVNSFGGSIPNLATTPKEMVQKVVGSVQNLNMLNETYNEALMSEADVEDSNSIVTLLPKLPTGFPSYDEIMCREVGFVMLQLVNGLKNLQAKGIEEMPMSLSNVILCKEVENKEAQARLCVLQSQDINREEEEPMGTLCQCALVALTQLLPMTKLTSIFADILKLERSESLSKIKSLLEYALWGPSDITLSGTQKERESSLQRWLDLERATVLHGLVRTRVDLTVYDECHLMFLVRSTAKAMAEASMVLNNYLEGLNQECN